MAKIRDFLTNFQNFYFFFEKIFRKNLAAGFCRISCWIEICFREKKSFWKIFGMKFFWIFFRLIRFFSKSARGFDFLFARNGSSGVLGTRIYPQNPIGKRKIELYLAIIRELWASFQGSETVKIMRFLWNLGPKTRWKIRWNQSQTTVMVR